MSYKSDLEKKYAEIKNRMYGKSVAVINENAIRAAQQVLWDTPPNTFDDLEPPVQVGGVVGPTGVIIPEPLVKSGLTPLVDTKQTYINMLRFVAKKHRIDPELIQGPLRFKKIVAARHELWWRVKTEMNYSYARIGRLANRDHSTIIHAVETFAAKALDSKEARVQSGRAA
jgi:hypothetical protein